MRIAKDLTELIGNTPLLKLERYGKKHFAKAEIIAKLEYFNPMGSAKDRVALFMIEEGMKKGSINQDTVLIEPTSGNTGIGLAFVAVLKGLKLVLTMPETMSIERRKIVAALGAEVVLTPGAEGMQGAIKKAEELKEKYGNAIILQQFENPANPEAHRQTTAEEIWKDTDGNVDILVASVGTGGTITGTGEILKKKNPKIKIVAVEPANSPILSGGKAGAHKIQGIGAGFIPEILNCDLFDEIITVKDEDAYETAREVAKTEGLMLGVSSGATLYAAAMIAARLENEGKRIVAICTDHGERYLSGDLY